MFLAVRSLLSRSERQESPVEQAAVDATGATVDVPAPDRRETLEFVRCVCVDAPSPPRPHACPGALDACTVLRPPRLTRGCMPAPVCVRVRACSSVWPLLRRHYEWYKSSQRGPRPLSYRWRGGTPGHLFASGLDDYPRGHVSSRVPCILRGRSCVPVVCKCCR
jgi:hypothetical protein